MRIMLLWLVMILWFGMIGVIEMWFFLVCSVYLLCCISCR